jgi:hypothetical protein
MLSWSKFPRLVPRQVRLEFRGRHADFGGFTLFIYLHVHSYFHSGSRLAPCQIQRYSPRL